MKIELLPVEGIGEVAPGDDLAAVILGALARAALALRDHDVVVITHKVVSKAEGGLVAVADDADYRRVVENESVAVIRRRGELVIAETRHGFVCANAGVDRSNVTPGMATILPRDPDASAHAIRTRLERACGVRLAVVITDTFGRAWRKGLTDVAIGVSGMPAIVDLRGTTDTYGRVLEVTEVAIADEMASAADLVMGKSTGTPVAIVRGATYPVYEGRGADLVRDPADDLFR